MSQVVVAALYRFVPLPDFQALREPLLNTCLRLRLKGTLLLAGEGINGTVAGSRDAVDALLAALRRDARLAAIDHRESSADDMPFQRMKVKLRKEIVTLGVAGVNPHANGGTPVQPRDWNALIADPQLLLLDTRNDYEVGIGTFRGAVNPGITTFREFPDYVRKHFDPARHKKIAMFCTGGVRCEKASAFLRKAGYEAVYQLQGGILHYLQEVPMAQSRWQGECFVFDERVSVNHQLQPGSYDQCHGCRRPITEADKQSARYRPGVCCPVCYDRLSAAQKARFAERRKQRELATARRDPGTVPPPAMQKILVWDLPTRLFHWGIVLTMGYAWYCAEIAADLEQHFRAGYVALGLVLFRLIWGFVGTRHARYADFICPPRPLWHYAQTFFSRSGRRYVGHNPLGGLAVLAMLLLLLLQTGSGLFADDELYYSGPLNGWVSRAAAATLTTIHHLNFNLLLGMVGLHLLAIIYYRLYRKEPLTLAMFSGKKTVAADIATAGVAAAGRARPGRALLLAALLATALYGLVNCGRMSATPPVLAEGAGAWE